MRSAGMRRAPLIQFIAVGTGAPTAVARPALWRPGQRWRAVSAIVSDMRYMAVDLDSGVATLPRRKHATKPPPPPLFSRLRTAAVTLSTADARSAPSHSVKLGSAKVPQVPRRSSSTAASRARRVHSTMRIMMFQSATFRNMPSTQTQSISSFLSL